MKPMVAVVSGIASISGVVGGGFLVNAFISKDRFKETLEDYFKSRSLILISSLNASKEEKQWNEEFSLDQVAIKEYNNQITSGKQLKTWCQDNLKLEKKKNEELIPHLRKWCTLGTVEDRIIRVGDGELITDINGAEWTQVYERNSTADARAKINLNGTKDQNSSNQAADIQAIKIFCTNNKRKVFLAEEKEKVYDVVIQWCTKNKSSANVQPHQ